MGISSPLSRFFDTVRFAGAMPAQLTKMRSTPFAARALASAASTEASSVTSASQKVRPCLAGDRAAALGVHVEDGDLGAREASRRAVASPRPEAPPVTIAATDLSSFMGYSPCLTAL